MSVELKDVTYTYNPGTVYEMHALEHVSMEIPDGQFVGVIGHTGSGKSTLVQHFNGLIRPTSGHVYYPRGRDEILDQLALLHETRGISVMLVSHSMEDIARYVERIIVMNKGHVAFNDTPKKVFSHYKELEKMGLAAPQMTYIMHALKERGMDVDVTATTVEEAKTSILKALKRI